MNGTYDNYHRRLRKFRISIQVMMILSVCVLTALSIFRIYMLNGFETQWPFQKAREVVAAVVVLVVVHREIDDIVYVA